MVDYNSWVINKSGNGEHIEKARLFCLPYAGGGMAPFFPWIKRIHPDFTLIRVKLPGREDRLREKPILNMHELVETLAIVLKPLLNKPYALFGHSLGALTAFELAAKLEKMGLPIPIHLFVSGFRAPHLKEQNPIDPNLSDQEFIKKLDEYEGMDERILSNPELVELILPIIRADFQILWTYKYDHKPPLKCPISAFGGLNDKKTRTENIAAWEKHTLSTFNDYYFEGGHFFIHDHQDSLLSTINKNLHVSLKNGGRCNFHSEW